MSRRLKSTVLQCLGYTGATTGIVLSLSWDRWQWAVGGLTVCVFLAVVDGATGNGKGEPAKSRVLMVIGFGLLVAALLTWLVTGQWWWTIVGLVTFVGTVIVDAVTDAPRSVSPVDATRERYR
jgi:hypothetical protein